MADWKGFAAAMLALVFTPLAGAQGSSVGDDPVMMSLSGPWRSGPKLDTARAGLAAASLDGRIYAAGGAGVVDPRDDFEVYDPAVNRWTPVSPMPVGLERFGMTAAAGKIWIAGGYSAESGASPITEAWSYDPVDNAWVSEPPLPGPKAAFSLLAQDGVLYAIGGEDGAPGVFVFDLEARRWSAIDAPRETNRRGAAALVVDGEIWLIGGAGEGRATSRVDIFDPETRAWRRGPELPRPRAGHAAAVIDGAVHVFGGRSADLRRTLSDHLRLDPGGDVWAEAPALPAPRTEAAAAALQDQVFLIGGGAGSGFFAPFTAVDSVDILRIGE